MSRLCALIFSLSSLTVFLAGCPKECRDPSFCTRTCDCNDDGRIIECPLSFECNIEGDALSGYCEDDFNDLSCREICDTYAARNLCGSRVCRDEFDCEVRVLCEQRDPMSGQLIGQYDCARQFACDIDVGACEAAFAVSDSQHCQLALAEGTCNSVQGVVQ